MGLCLYIHGVSEISTNRIARIEAHIEAHLVSVVCVVCVWPVGAYTTIDTLSV